MTGMSIDGKMSVGALRIDRPPPIAMSSAITTNVYGLLRAVLTSHIEGYECAPDGAAVLAARHAAARKGLFLRRGQLRSLADELHHLELRSRHAALGRRRPVRDERVELDRLVDEDCGLADERRRIV